MHNSEQADAIDKALRDRIIELERQRDELLTALEDVLPWVVTKVVACGGMKCRTPICMSCTEEDKAEKNADIAYEKYSAAKATIAEARKEQ